MARHHAPDHEESIEEMKLEFKEGMDAIDELEKSIRQGLDVLENLSLKH